MVVVEEEGLAARAAVGPGTEGVGCTVREPGMEPARSLQDGGGSGSQ